MDAIGLIPHQGLTAKLEKYSFKWSHVGFGYLNYLVFPSFVDRSEWTKKRRIIHDSPSSFVLIILI